MLANLDKRHYILCILLKQMVVESGAGNSGELSKLKLLYNLRIAAASEKWKIRKCE